MSNSDPSRAATEEELQRLARVPLLVLYLIAGADGKISKKEITAFETAADEITADTSPLLAEALDRLMESFNTYDSQIQQNGMDPWEDLRLAGKTLSECFPEEAASFKQGLTNLGISVAAAAGGGLLRLGPKVSPEEMATLAAIHHALDGHPLSSREGAAPTA